MRRRTALRGLAALLAAGATGCSRDAATARSDEDAAPAGSGHLRRQIDDFPRTLDPSLSTEIPAQRVLDDLFEGLVRLDSAGNTIPGVAKRWMQSDDGRRWTFELREDARWSNGDRVTAQDFVYAWRRLVDPATRSRSVQQVAAIHNALAIAEGDKQPDALGVAALGDHALEVHLERRVPWFLYLLTNNFLMPLHRPTIEAQGSGWARAGTLVGNGPFVLGAMRINGPMRLERNPHHPEAGALRLQTVTHYPVRDRGATTSRYLAGDLDVTDGFQLDDMDWLRQRLLPGELRLAPYFGTVMFGFQTAKPPFDDRALRLALNLAIDREVLADKLLRRVYLPAWTVVPPMAGYAAPVPDWAHRPAAERHARARELYAEAGYSSARPLRVEMVYPTQGQDVRRVLEAITAMWRSVLGAEVKLVNQEFRVFVDNRTIGRHLFCFNAWIGDYPDPLTFLDLPRTTSAENWVNYANPRYDALLDQALASPDDAARLALYAQAERVRTDDAIDLPLYYYQSRHLIKPEVRGWQDNVMDRHPSRELWLERA